MEKDIFTKKLQIPSVNFENTDAKTFSEITDLNILESKLEDKEINKEFNIHNYKWVIVFIIAIILFLLFINGMSIYKNNLFIK